MELSVQDITINELAEQIKSAHAHAEEGVRSSMTHALRAGELLTQAKARLPHGSWLPWLKHDCHVNKRTAQGYMRLYSKLGSKARRVAHLPLREALRLLAEASPGPREKSKRRPATSETAQPGDEIAIQIRREDIGLFQDAFTAGYKTLAMKMHPDTGGDDARMKALNALYAGLEKQLVAAAPREAAAA
jgi:hypothetical protein